MINATNSLLPLTYLAAAAADTAVESAAGARDLWQVIDAVGTSELGGAAQGARHRPLAGAGLRPDTAAAPAGAGGEVATARYQHPGVYLEEIGLTMTPIDGVPTSAAPQWTDANTHDPGISLLELLVYAAEAGLGGSHPQLADQMLHLRAGLAGAAGLEVERHSTAANPWAKKP